jgi:hypothetical protein
MYRKDVEAVKTKGWSVAGHEDDDESALDLPTPLSEAHDAQTYIFSVLPLFFSSPTSMFQLTETTLFHWDLAYEFSSHRLYNAKNDFTGPQTATKVQMWMRKMQTRPSRDGGGSDGYVTTIPNTKYTSSSGSQQLIVTSLRSSNDGLGYRGSDVEVSDGAYRDPKHGQQAPSAVRGSPSLCVAC